MNRSHESDRGTVVGTVVGDPRRSAVTARRAFAPPSSAPRWVIVVAAIGMALIVIPVVAMAGRVDWPEFIPLITSPSSLAALGLSLRTATVSAVICIVLGVPMALWFARSRSRAVGILRTAVLLPLVLPPVVGGIALLAAFGRRGLFGPALESAGIQIAFTTAAVVLAQTFVAMPFLVLSVEGALRTVGTRPAAIAASLGAAPTAVLWRVTLPAIAPAIAAGAVLAFARALGEFGATLAFAGSLEGVTRTLPLEIYLQRESDPASAVALSMLLVIIAIAVMAGTGLVRRRA